MQEAYNNMGKTPHQYDNVIFKKNIGLKPNKKCSFKKRPESSKLKERKGIHNEVKPKKIQ